MNGLFLGDRTEIDVKNTVHSDGNDLDFLRRRQAIVPTRTFVLAAI